MLWVRTFVSGSAVVHGVFDKYIRKMTVCFDNRYLTVKLETGNFSLFFPPRALFICKLIYYYREDTYRIVL